MIKNPIEVYVQDFKNLRALVQHATNILLTGSFSQRRPDLGAMKTCPFCGVRRRENLSSPARLLGLVQHNGTQCCNPKYADTQRAWDPEKGFHQVECEPRIGPMIPKKSFIKKLMHKKHGQNRRWHIRQLQHRLQNEPGFLREILLLTRMPAPKPEHMPSFAEQLYYWLQKHPNARPRWTKTREEKVA